MKKTLALTLALVLLALTPLFSGVAAAEWTGVQRDESVTGKVTIWCTFGSEEDAFGQYLKAFPEKYPNVEYDFVFYNGEDYRTQIRMALTSGEAPDILFTYAGENFQEFVDTGSLLDVTDIVAENGFLDRVDSPAYFDSFTVDGRLLGMPIGGVTVWQTLYANKTILDQYGIEIPKTTEDLIAAAKILRANNIQPVAFGDVDGWPAVLLLGDYFYQESPFSDAENLISGEAKFADSDSMKAALGTLGQLGAEGVFMDGFATEGLDSAVNLFTSQKAAFFYLGSWWTALTGGKTDFGFELVPLWLPRIVGVSDLAAVQMSCDNVMMINKDCNSVDAAVAFMNYFSCEEAQAIYCESNNIFSIYPGLNAKLNFDPIFMNPVIQDQFTYDKTGVFFDNAFPIAIREKMKTTIQEVMLGRISVDEALASWDFEMQK